MSAPLLPRDTLGFKDLSAHAIRYWRLIVIVSLGLLLLAGSAWRSIPRREEPKVDTAFVKAVLIYPGASPEDVESQVIKPIEDDLRGMAGLKSIENTALPNAATFFLEFDDGVDMDVVVEKIRGKIQARRKDMPAEVKDPDVVHVTTYDLPQMVVAVVGNRADEVLTEAAKNLKRELAAVPGVAGVDLRGERKRAIRIQLDPVRLQQHRLSAETVVQQLQLANVRIPAGELKMGSLSTLLQVQQEFKDVSSVIKVPVGSSADGKGGSQVVSLGDVASVKDDALTQTELFMFRGQPAVGLEIRFLANENAVKIGDRVRQRLVELRPNAPPGSSFEIAHDQPQWVSKDIASFLDSLRDGIALVLLVITLGMGWRAALVVAGVLPLAAAGAIFGLYVFGYSLDQVSIAGLIVALGLLVDDAVVVTESIQIMRDKGLSAVRAAVFGTSRVFSANNGTTAVACASFLPLFFMGSSIGQYVAGLPAAVIFSLVTSLLVAQLFTPWISTFLIKTPAGVTPIPDTEPFARSEDSGGEHDEKNPVIRYLKGLYGRRILWIVTNPVKVIGLATALLVGSFFLLPFIGVEFFPTSDRPAFFVTVQMPRGTREDITAEKVSETVSLIQKQPEIESVSAVIGAGYPWIYSGRFVHGPSKDFSDILVRLKDGEKTEPVAARLRRTLASVPGASIAVQVLSYGVNVEHPIMIRIFGDDYRKLRDHAEELRAELQKQKGVINVQDTLSLSVPVSRVALDADKAKRVGITPGQVGGTLRWLYGEDKITEFRIGDEAIQVVIEPRSVPGAPLSAVEEALVPSAQGTAVPVRQAGRAELGWGFAELSRRNGRRMVLVSADVEAGALPTEIVQKIEPYMAAKKWDPGYTYTFAGDQAETEQSFKNLGLAAFGALLLIFVLLVLMFDSFVVSMVVMAAVPYALIGALTGLAVTGNRFSFMSFLGLIALIGVYVNHKIYFVERMLELMARGDDMVTAITHAGQDRLRPVVLTALTAILGLLPLTLFGGKLWTGFGWVNIFGLMASIALSLILLPAFIALAYRITGRDKARHAAPEAPRPSVHAPPFPAPALLHPTHVHPLSAPPLPPPPPHPDTSGLLR